MLVGLRCRLARPGGFLMYMIQFNMSPGAKRVWGQSATPVSEEVKRRFSRLTRYMMVFTPVMLILTFMPIDTEPWV